MNESESSNQIDLLNLTDHFTKQKKKKNDVKIKCVQHIRNSTCDELIQTTTTTTKISFFVFLKTKFTGVCVCVCWCNLSIFQTCMWKNRVMFKVTISKFRIPWKNVCVCVWREHQNINQQMFQQQQQQQQWSIGNRKCFEAIFFQMIKLRRRQQQRRCRVFFLLGRKILNLKKKLSNDNRKMWRPRDQPYTPTIRTNEQNIRNMHEWMNVKKSEQQQTRHEQFIMSIMSKKKRKEKKNRLCWNSCLLLLEQSRMNKKKNNQHQKKMRGNCSKNST